MHMRSMPDKTNLELGYKVNYEIALILYSGRGKREA